jgi:predicted O-methyltransferase YrrM
MRTIKLSAHVLSDPFWYRVLEHAAPRRLDHADALFRDLGSLDSLASNAQYKTGSISTATQWNLFALAYQWQPGVVAEIGTYIGKSTIALARGADAAGIDCEVHTCDASNTMELPKLSRARVIQYPRNTSTLMLTEMIEDGYTGKVQLVHVDGRLGKEDIALTAQLCAPDAILALDDFEGIEKGVANLFNLRTAKVFSDHHLFYPPSDSLLRMLGFQDRCTTAVLAPRELIQLTAQ